jgi:hypothetical protein
MFKSCEISCSIIALILYCIVYYHIYFCLKHRFHFTSSDSPLNVRRRRLIFIMSFKPSNTTSLSPHTHLTPHTSHTLSTHTSISSIYILYRFLYPIYTSNWHTPSPLRPKLNTLKLHHSSSRNSYIFTGVLRVPWYYRVPVSSYSINK